MDKLKPLTRFLRKYHFWLFCGVILLLGPLIWFMARSKLQSDLKNWSGQIDSKFQTAQQIRSLKNRTADRSLHPNQVSAEGTQELIKGLRQRVKSAWERQYQRQGNILTWPRGLEAGFIEEVAGLRPIERKVPFPTPKDKEIHPDFLKSYRDYIGGELPQLAKSIGARWTAESVSGVEGGRFSSPSPPPRGSDFSSPTQEEPPVVQWNNQEEVLKRFDWSHKANGAPSTLEMLYAQEDLWVLQSIMMIIKKTNEGADAAHNANIRVIESIQLGRDAQGRFGAITPVVGTTAEGGEGGIPGSLEVPPPTGGMPLEGQGRNIPGLEGAVTAEDPAEGRYVDPSYAPLPAEKLRGEESTEVGKRMPIRLRLVIDQRKIPKFLTECGNSPLTVEVRQLRINPDAAGGSATGGGSRGGFQFTGPDGGAGGRGGNSSGSMNPYPYDVTIEVYGIVYVYNPVNDALLKIEAADETATTEQGNTPTTPPAAPETSTEVPPPAEPDQPEVVSEEPAGETEQPAVPAEPTDPAAGEPAEPAAPATPAANP